MNAPKRLYPTLRCKTPVVSQSIWPVVMLAANQSSIASSQQSNAPVTRPSTRPTTDNPAVAVVKDGAVTAKGSGRAVITVTSNQNEEKKDSVTIKKINSCRQKCRLKIRGRQWWNVEKQQDI